MWTLSTVSSRRTAQNCQKLGDFITSCEIYNFLRCSTTIIVLLYNDMYSLTVSSSHRYPHVCGGLCLRLVLFPALEVALYGVPADGGEVNLGGVQVGPDSLVTSGDLKLPPEDLQPGPDVEVGQAVVLRPAGVNLQAAGDVQVAPGEELSSSE